jgi:hypothetical protein
MKNPGEPVSEDAAERPAEEGLRQVLLRLTRPGYEPLQEEILDLREKLQALEAILKNLGLELREEDSQLLKQVRELRQEVVDPEAVSQRVAPELVPLLHTQARQNREALAEAVAPVIGPAIRSQIRAAKGDIIEALSPLIGQIIGKAISEAFRELTRNIDARLRRQFQFRERFSRWLARLKGVSEADLLLREALPYSIQHVFLIHRQSGLLLERLSAAGEAAQDLDLISGMLTAIQDFMRESFGKGEGDLEEIAQGDRRILLEGGQCAILAVVVKGVEPVGFARAIHQTIHDLHQRHARELCDFDGNMARLPDLKPALAPLLAPDPEALPGESSPASMTQAQKWAAGAALGGAGLALALLIFACLFTVRLWPYAFAPVLPTSSATQTLAFPTATATLTQTATARPSLTPTYTLSPAPSPTLTPSNTPTPTPTSTPAPIVGQALGSLNVRAGPGVGFPVLGAVTSGQRLAILDRQGEWFSISAELENGETLLGWVWSRFVTFLPEG